MAPALEAVRSQLIESERIIENAPTWRSDVVAGILRQEIGNNVHLFVDHSQLAPLVALPSASGNAEHPEKSIPYFSA